MMNESHADIITLYNRAVENADVWGLSLFHYGGVFKVNRKDQPYKVLLETADLHRVLAFITGYAYGSNVKKNDEPQD